MTPRYPLPPSCLTPEDLAALAGGTLPSHRRESAEAHLASCADCYDVLIDLLAMREDSTLQSTSAAPVVLAMTPRTTRRLWTMRTYTVSGLAAAAAVLMTVWIGPRLFYALESPDRKISGAVNQLAQAVGADRATEARLTGGFGWGPAPGVSRGAGRGELPLPVQQAVLTIKTLAAAHHDARALNALGLAQLVAGDSDAGLAALDEAVALDPNDAAVREDLAAARLERWRRTRTARDAAEAVDAAEQALLRAPTDAIARFNHALAVEAIGLNDAAIASWTAYLQLDHASSWAAEARQHLTRLQGGGETHAAASTLSDHAADAELNQLAAADPLVLERYLTDQWLDTWRRSTTSWPESAAAALGPRAARALVIAGRDHYLPDVVMAAASSANWAGARRECLMQATLNLDASRVAYTASRTVQAEALGRQARAGFICAGAPTIEADAQIAWTVFFQQRTPTGLDEIAHAAESAGDWRALGRIQYVRGLASTYSGHLSDSDAWYERAVAAYDRAGDVEAASTTWTMRAEVSLAWGDDAGVWTRHQKAFAAFRLLSPRRRHIALVDASIAATGLSLPGAARFFADALVDADQHGSDPALLAGADLQSASARFAMGDTASALAALNAARDVFPRIADPALRAQFGAEIDAQTGTIDSAIDPARAITVLTSAMQVFTDTGRPLRRARLLLDRGRAYKAAGNAAAAEQDWSAGAAIFEDQRPSIRDAQLRIDHLDKLWDLFRELISIRGSNSLASLDVAERFRGRALLDAVSNGAELQPLSGSALYEWLPPHVTAIAYAVLPDRLFRWTITRSGVTVDQQPIAADQLSSLVVRYNTAIANDRLHNSGGSLEAGELSRLLLPAALKPGPAERVVFLPDGPLFQVPFGTLALPGAAHPLVEDVVPSIAPSLTILKTAGAARRNTATMRAMLVAAGDAHPREGLAALPGAAAEIRDLRSLYQSPEILEGTDVTAPAVLSAMARADVLHFAGHAIADPVSTNRSRLLLSETADPSALTFDDLRRAVLRPGMIVVLSACDAARGRVFHGEGAVSLAYPFLANGASSVVASLWQVDDAASSSLWRRFHERLLAGDAPDVALAESQRMSRRSGTNTAAWAAFEAVGGLVRQ